MVWLCNIKKWNAICCADSNYGGNPRVGLEDNLYLEKGKLATNPQLVEKAIRIVNDLGVSIMTPAETREKLKLKNYK